jgi:hypothetical protein
VDHVVAAIDKISDSNVRGPLLNWFYFFRTQSLIRDKKLEEARLLATKVSELDQRAYLYSKIAEESLKLSEDQTQARQMLTFQTPGFSPENAFREIESSTLTGH